MNLKTSYSSLKDKVVFVLGGSTGIGATLVEEFAKQGSKVAFVGRSRARGVSARRSGSTRS